MAKIRVLMTLRFTPAQLDRLRAVSPDLEVVQKSVREGRDAQETGDLLDGPEEVLYCMVPPRDLSRAPNLKWVQLHSAGINHLGEHPILQSSIRLTTSSGIHATPIGEFVLAAMLALARHVPRMVRMQDRRVWPERRWEFFRGTELRGHTLGIVGYGSIGRETARLAKLGFGMRILALTRDGSRRDRGYVEPGTGDPEGELPDGWFKPPQLGELLPQADFLLVSAPLTGSTRRMIGEAELRAMKPTAVLVNVARGGLVDEAALARALRENRIAGAALDVFETEPLPAESELWKLENVLLAPHISAATSQYDDRAVALFCENLRRYLRGEPLLNLVDREKGY